MLLNKTSGKLCHVKLKVIVEAEVEVEVVDLVSGAQYLSGWVSGWVGGCVAGWYGLVAFEE